MEQAQTLISVKEYLSEVYTPDMDYVDGVLEERHMGEKGHGKLIFRMAVLLRRAKLASFIETRLKVTPTRYRVPDICAYESEPDEEVFTTPPLVCIEILSPEDRFSRVNRVAKDYFSIGVRFVWILEPVEQKIYEGSTTGLQERPHLSLLISMDQGIHFSHDSIFGQNELI